MITRLKYREFSRRFQRRRDLFYLYKTMTPTRHGSTLETLRYAWKHRESTFKLFGIFDTGRKDYGIQMYRHPWQAMKMYAYLIRHRDESRETDRRGRTRRRRRR